MADLRSEIRGQRSEIRGQRAEGQEGRGSEGRDQRLSRSGFQPRKSMSEAGARVYDC